MNTAAKAFKNGKNKSGFKNFFLKIILSFKHEYERGKKRSSGQLKHPGPTNRLAEPLGPLGPPGQERSRRNTKCRIPKTKKRRHFSEVNLKNRCCSTSVGPNKALSPPK